MTEREREEFFAAFRAEIAAILADDLTDEEFYINVVEYAGNAQSHLSYRGRKRA